MLTLFVVLALGAVLAQDAAESYRKCVTACAQDTACIRKCSPGFAELDCSVEPKEVIKRARCCANRENRPDYCARSTDARSTPERTPRSTRERSSTPERTTRDGLTRPEFKFPTCRDANCFCYVCRLGAAGRVLPAAYAEKCASLKCPEIKVEVPKVHPCEGDVAEANKERCCIAKQCSSAGLTTKPKTKRGAELTTVARRSVEDIKKCAVEKCGYKAPEPKERCDGSVECCKALFARGVKADVCERIFKALNDRRENAADKPEAEDDTTLDNPTVRDRIAKACKGNEDKVCCFARSLAIKDADKKKAALLKCREKFTPKEETEACDASLRCKAEGDEGVRKFCVAKCKHDVDTTVVPPTASCDIRKEGARACLCKTERGAKLDACAERVLGDSVEDCRAKAKEAQDREAFAACVAGEDKERKDRIVTVKDGDKIGAVETKAAANPQARCTQAVNDRIRKLIKNAPTTKDGKEKTLDVIGRTVAAMKKACQALAEKESAEAKEDAKDLRAARTTAALKALVEKSKEAKERREKYVARLRDAAKKFQAAAADTKAALKAARDTCKEECEKDADCGKACLKKAAVAEFKDIPCERFENFREKVLALDSARKAVNKAKRVFVFFNRVCAPKADAADEEADKKEKRQAAETVTFTVTVTGEDADEAATVVANLPGDAVFVEGTTVDGEADPAETTATTTGAAKPTDSITADDSSASSVAVTFVALACAIFALF